MTILLAVIAAGWLLTALMIAIGGRFVTHLRDVPYDTHELPPVSMVIAARNEAANIEQALQSVLAQQYERLQVIVVDDRSTDATGAVLDRMAAAHPRLHVVHVATLPERWLGKNHALQIGGEQATGDYIVFADADVVMERTVLARSVCHCRRHSLDHLTMLPDVPRSGYFADAFMGEFGLNFVVLLQPWFARTGLMPIAAGIGAFNLVGAQAYRAIGGHTRIPLRADDDITLAYLLRKAGFRQDVLVAHELISVPWYTGLREGVRSLEKNALAPFNYRITPLVAAIALHFTFGVLPWLTLAFGTPAVRAFSAGAIAARMLAWVANTPVSRRGARYLIATPIAALLFEYSLVRSAVLTRAQGGIRWRETFYPLALLRTNKL